MPPRLVAALAMFAMKPILLLFLLSVHPRRASSFLQRPLRSRRAQCRVGAFSLDRRCPPDASLASISTAAFRRSSRHRSAAASGPGAVPVVIVAMSSEEATSNSEEKAEVTPQERKGGGDFRSTLYGGDYAGLSATFSSSTGELIRVPEHLVPDSMIEWGQVPSCLEVLTSEDFLGEDEGDGGAAAVKTTTTMARKVVSVMPEVGCGVDNLDAMRTAEDFDLPAKMAAAAFDRGTSMAAVIGRPLPPLRRAERVRIEASFSLPPEIEVAEGSDDGERVSYSRRLRVSFDAVPSTRSVSSPITVVRERRTSGTSSSGTIGLGGGLDGRTVTSLVGRANANRPFAEEEVTAKEGIGRKGWSTVLSLPGNVIVRIGGGDGALEAGNDEGKGWAVDIGLISDKEESRTDEDGGRLRTLSVVRLLFSVDKEGAARWKTEFISEEC